MKRIAFAAAALLAVSGCKPSAEQIELVLGAQGMPAPQAQCIGAGLQSLDEDDWTKLASVASDFVVGKARLETLTLGDVQQRLQQIDDPRLLGTMVRTGLACTLMHGEFDAALGEAPLFGGRLQSPDRAPLLP